VSNQYLLDRETRRQILVQRFGESVWRSEIAPIIRLMRDDVTRLLRGTDAQRLRGAAILNEIDAIVNARTGQMQTTLFDQMSEFASAEVLFQERLFERAIAVDVARPDPEQIRAAITTARMSLVSGQSIEQQTLSGLVEQFSTKKRVEIRRLIAAGSVEGRTSDQIARDVGRLVQTRTAQQARSLVRTATNHTATIARQETMRANADVLEGERFIATLDDRTTMTCAGFDQQVFDVGAGPMPPVHWGCRSTRAPVVKREFRVPGLDGERASVDGPVNAQTTYGGFLKRQSAEFQDEVLGPERAKLFRSGQVSIDKFTDDAGRVLTLEQLRSREGLLLD
jgi:SPP1 gp7 family putative phage head morphogenesis protein